MQHERDILADLDVIIPQNGFETQALAEMKEESQIPKYNGREIQNDDELQNIYWAAQELIEKKERGGISLKSEQENTESYAAQEQRLSRKIFGTIKFLTQYTFTSLLIFALLMVGVNHQAYYQLLNAYINAEQMEQNKQSMIESVSAASQVVREQRGGENIDLSFITRQAEAKELSLEERHSPSRLLAKASREEINLDIAITPFEDRVVIPKIGKNIPLVEVSNRHAESVKDLHNIFMEELEHGVVRYPGTALPWEAGNSFIFWHSSNFPWIPGEYNEVFALLDRVVYGDEIIVYSNQKKYTYIVREKRVVRPGDSSVLKNTDTSRKYITLMTCWPIGTTTNRLLVIWELLETK